MRIATWNVNSLKARLERVVGWLDRAAPDVLLLQETKLADDDVPRDVLAKKGYEVAHHGQGRWNGVAIVSRVGIDEVDVGFGEGAGVGGAEDDPIHEARVIAARCGGVRVVSVYAPNGRRVDSPFYVAKLAWLDRFARWLDERFSPDEPLIVGGDFNVAPTDADVFDPAACNGGTHVSPKERERFARLVSWGLVDAYRARHAEPDRFSWWDYRAGDFHMNRGMRIDHLLVSRPIAARMVDVEIDRETRKGKPTPSDHAPVTIDVDERGREYDAGWKGAEERIAARRGKK